MRDPFIEHFGGLIKHRGFNGRAMAEMRATANGQRIGNKPKPEPKPVDPSTILPDRALGLCDLRAKLIEYETADLETLIDFDVREPYGRDGFIIRKKTFEAFAGVDKMGSGCYSDVYAIDDKRVLKVVKVKDDGYARFVAKVRADGGDNPHLPKIFYSGVWSGKTVSVLERLTDGHSDIKDMFIRIIERNRSITPNPYIMVSESISHAAKLLDGLCNDLHGGNVMFRGDCPVITDPSTS